MKLTNDVPSGLYRRGPVPRHELSQPCRCASCVKPLPTHEYVLVRTIVNGVEWTDLFHDTPNCVKCKGRK